MSVKLRWLGVACFEMVLPTGETVVIDPYLDDSFTAPVDSDAITRADWILLTHGHYDHILDIGKIANRCGSTVICSDVAAQSLVELLGVDPKQIRVATMGDRLNLGALSVEVFPGIHVDLGEAARQEAEERRGSGAPPEATLDDALKSDDETIRRKAQNARVAYRKYPGGQQLNYCLQLPGNLRLYMFGSVPDASLLPVVRGARPNVILLQLIKRWEEKAAELAVQSGCQIVIPQHHDALFPNRPVPDVARLEAIVGLHPHMQCLLP
ncbi:MAG: MBL fold metallo-hydrolase, partial [Dehalococcoidia bacterium]|nr:MBL fold metallo-hydrolase [Dehalococcoidia bacterium]